VKEDNRYLPLRRSMFRNLRTQFEVIANPPYIGVTQGGSSRKNAGARVAATDGRWRPEPVKKERV
jgi:methylase of polypeptide subunit release factors